MIVHIDIARDRRKQENLDSMIEASEYGVTADRLIRLEKRIEKPHVVILGAGASLAAFPEGDANGKRLPLMADLVEVVGLQADIAAAGFDPKSNFETIYSRLHAENPNSPVLKQIEEAVQEYFGALALPYQPTLYDILLLSLRDKDAIFTFNWDPFLADAYARHVNRRVRLPGIFHLHGNVRAMFCETCGRVMRLLMVCPKCQRYTVPTPLLYPVEQKNYADNGFIRSQWDQVRDYLKDAFIITFFGYRAPQTDQEAIAIFKEAWKGKGIKRLVERVEIIDVRDVAELITQWHDFSFHGHYDIHSDLFKSRLCRYPRRSCESLYWPGVHGKWTEEVPWVGSNPKSRATLQELRASIEDLQTYEEQRA